MASYQLTCNLINTVSIEVFSSDASSGTPRTHSENSTLIPCQHWLFKSRLFSYSASILDDNNSVVCSMKRAGWFGYCYRIITSKGHYKFYRKWGEYFLKAVDSDGANAARTQRQAEAGAVFNNNMTSDFYSQGRRVSVMEEVEGFACQYRLSIESEDHKEALLIASCLLCLFRSNNGMAAGS